MRAARNRPALSVAADLKSVGIDIGSTTIKAALIDADGEILFSRYERHYSNIREATLELLREISAVAPSARFCAAGSW